MTEVTAAITTIVSREVRGNCPAELNPVLP